MSHPVQSNDLIKSHGSLITASVPLADKNWFRSGGSARYFAEPTTPEEFQTALLFALNTAQPIFMLGHGANILISDEGFNGLVIRPQLNEITYKNLEDNAVSVTVGAGVSMDTLITWCLENNIIGLEEFSGIPGTVGGSVYINLHYFEFLLGQFLTHARIIERATGNLITVDNAWFNFGYNSSTLHNEQYYLLEATFNLKRVSELEAAYAKGRRTEIMRHRFKRYPTAGTCGSFFRNFHPDEVTLESNGKKIIFVAYYLDKIGVKGNLRVGDAQVSHQHANMIVNVGNATSNDIIMLARTMQKMVHDAFGILPQPECRLIGFDQYPLL